MTFETTKQNKTKPFYKRHKGNAEEQDVANITPGNMFNDDSLFSINKFVNVFEKE